MVEGQFLVKQFQVVRFWHGSFHGGFTVELLTIFALDLPQDMFVTKLTKTLSKTNKLSKRKKRGWFTKEAMARVLNWSAPLVL